MKLAILGYGVEGKSVEKYFKTHSYKDTPASEIEITVFDQFNDAEIKNLGLENFDVVFRSPSVRLHPEIKANWDSITNYFFRNCPAKIIGVTGTKGKGTTCTMAAALLESIGETVHVVGNIGRPALEELDKIKENDVVVYELSSFQLWDLKKSPFISVVLRIEPDHLDVHKDFEDYLNAKSNIVKHQTENDTCIYYLDNSYSVNIGKSGESKKLSYPLDISEELLEILDNLSVPGAHNREDAEAALLTVYAYENPNLSFNDFLRANLDNFKTAFSGYVSLPHHIEFVRELNGVKYYDDNYSSAFPALDVAISAFGNQPVVLIAGGKDRGLDLSKVKERLASAGDLVKAILIGETKEKLATGMPKNKCILADDLKTAVETAQQIAEEKSAYVIMSPGAPSFDMFKNFKDRGDKFQKIVKGLK